jgi:hypothetical protein
MSKHNLWKTECSNLTKNQGQKFTVSDNKLNPNEIDHAFVFSVPAVGNVMVYVKDQVQNIKEIY